MNKICPENLKTIVAQLAQIDLKRRQDLELVIRIIFEKALAEPHWCETYADMVFLLRDKYPEFPPETEGEPVQTFTRMLLDICQATFESFPSSFEPSPEAKKNMDEEDLCKIIREKLRMLANMKFIGNLFLRQLLGVRVIGQVVYALIGMSASPPEDHKIECVCELLHTIGHELDGQKHGRQLLLEFIARLLELKRLTTTDGKPYYSKRTQFQIQELLDLRKNSWQKKMFKETAKTKSDIRHDALTAGCSPESMFSTQIAGQRPAYIDAFKRDAARRRARPETEGPRRSAWDKAYVRRLFAYFCEDKDGVELAEKWKEGVPNHQEVKVALDALLEIGINEHSSKRDFAADAIVELVLRGCVDWAILDKSLSPLIEGLDDLKIYLPFCDAFVKGLLAKLSRATGNDANPVILPYVQQVGQEADSFLKKAEKCGSDVVN